MYCAWRIRQLTKDIASPRILEIGAGVGRLAEYTHRLGLTDYWIVDVPMTSLVQGHFLAARWARTGSSLTGSRTDRHATMP